MEINVTFTDMKAQAVLDFAKPSFFAYLDMLKPDTAKWIQFTGSDIDSGRVTFKFKDSQTTVGFSVGGILAYGIDYISFDDAYKYFKEAKAEYFGVKFLNKHQDFSNFKR